MTVYYSKFHKSEIVIKLSALFELRKSSLLDGQISLNAEQPLVILQMTAMFVLTLKNTVCKNWVVWTCLCLMSIILTFMLDLPWQTTSSIKKNLVYIPEIALKLPSLFLSNLNHIIKNLWCVLNIQPISAFNSKLNTSFGIVFRFYDFWLKFSIFNTIAIVKVGRTQQVCPDRLAIKVLLLVW